MSDPTLLADPAYNFGMNVGRGIVIAIAAYVGYRLFTSNSDKE